MCVLVFVKCYISLTSKLSRMQGSHEKHLPYSVVSLRHLNYKGIYIDGQIDGVQDLHIGSGIQIKMLDKV